MSHIKAFFLCWGLVSTLAGCGGASSQGEAAAGGSVVPRSDTRLSTGADPRLTFPTVDSTAAVAALKTAGQSKAGTVSQGSAVFRFYNRANGVHFYTISEAERDLLRNGTSTFQYEGPSFFALPATDLSYTSVHRFLNRSTGTHFFTISESERLSVQNNLGHIYQYEGVAWRARTSAGAGWVPMRRFFVAATSVHFYTANDAEYAALLRQPGYTYEGIGYHVRPSAQGITAGLDTSFAGRGWTISAKPSIDSGGAGSVLLPDGRLLVGGTCRTGDNHDFCVARYQTDGTLDTTFGTNGWASQTMTSFRGRAGSMVRLDDGKIVVGGTCTDLGEVGGAYCLVRFTETGFVDTTFGVNGISETWASQYGGINDGARTMAVQPDGKLVMSGECSFDICAIRLSSNGQPDPTFGNQGLSVIPRPDYSEAISSLRLDASGRVVMAGTCRNIDLTYSLCLTRLTAEGTLDTTFGNQGLTSTLVHNGLGAGAAQLLPAPDGGWLVAGICDMGAASSWDACLVKYSEDGIQDLTYGTAGTSVISVVAGAARDYLGTAAIDPDGHVVMAGHCVLPGTTAGTQFCAIRVTPQGALDTRFGTLGKIFLDLPGLEGSAWSLAHHPDGRWSLAGTCSTSEDNIYASTDFCVVRYVP